MFLNPGRGGPLSLPPHLHEQQANLNLELNYHTKCKLLSHEQALSEIFITKTHWNLCVFVGLLNILISFPDIMVKGIGNRSHSSLFCLKLVQLYIRQNVRKCTLSCLCLHNCAFMLILLYNEQIRIFYSAYKRKSKLSYGHLI